MNTMSMQNYLKKASKKLVEDPESEQKSEGEQHGTPQPTKKGAHAKQGGGAVHNAPAHAKKGTRKKI